MPNTPLRNIELVENNAKIIACSVDVPLRIIFHAVQNACGVLWVSVNIVSLAQTLSNHKQTLELLASADLCNNINVCKHTSQKHSVQQK